MAKETLANLELQEISRLYIIPPEIEFILKNAIVVRLDVETAFDESEKDGLPYTMIKHSIDAHVAGILWRCRKR